MKENVCAYKIIWKINAVLSIFFSCLSQGLFSSQFYQALREMELSQSTAQGLNRKVKLLLTATLLYLGKCLSDMKSHGPLPSLNVVVSPPSLATALRAKLD
jgi:hypothetical protein